MLAGLRLAQTDSETMDREGDGMVSCGWESDLYVQGKKCSGLRKTFIYSQVELMFSSRHKILVINWLLIMVWSICYEVLEEHLKTTVSKEAP